MLLLGINTVETLEPTLNPNTLRVHSVTILLFVVVYFAISGNTNTWLPTESSIAHPLSNLFIGLIRLNFSKDFVSLLQQKSANVRRRHHRRTF